MHQMTHYTHFFIALYLTLLCTGCKLSTYANQSYNTTPFDEKFQNITLRIDLTMRDTLPNSEVKIASISKMGEWTGRRGETYLIDNHPMGNFTYTIIDDATRDTIWTDGFCALYEEWVGTQYENKKVETYEHSILVPMPKRPATFVLEQRARNGVYSEKLRATLRHSDIRQCTTLLNPTVKTLRDSGDPAHTLDILILADHYTADEESAFDAVTDSLANVWFSRAPWSEYKDRVSFRTAFLPCETNETNNRISNPDSHLSPLNTQFGWHGSDRYLTTNQVFAQTDYAGNIPADFIIIAVNTNIYGGGGIYNELTTFSAGHPQAIELLIHEAGHGFAGLADEYFDNTSDGLDEYYDISTEPWEPNITSLKHFDLKWKTLYEDGRASLLEGAAYTSKGMYRASDVCLMRVLNEPFCPACHMAVERKIKEYLE